MVITLPYDPSYRALFWAKENCPSYITNLASPEEPGKIWYYFGQEAEGIMFMLKWS